MTVRHTSTRAMAAPATVVGCMLGDAQPGSHGLGPVARKFMLVCIVLHRQRLVYLVCGHPTPFGATRRHQQLSKEKDRLTVPHTHHSCPIISNHKATLCLALHSRKRSPLQAECQCQHQQETHNSKQMKQLTSSWQSPSPGQAPLPQQVQLLQHPLLWQLLPRDLPQPA